MDDRHGPGTVTLPNPPDPRPMRRVITKEDGVVARYRMALQAIKVATYAGTGEDSDRLSVIGQIAQ